MIRLLAAALLSLSACTAWAGWTVDGDQSHLSFVTVKAGNVGEVHTFGEIGGGVDDTGSVSVEVQLASVDTLIPIRDERMREILFEVADFPVATLSAQVDLEAVQAQAVGTVSQTVLEASLALKESTLPLTLNVAIARLNEGRIMVTSTRPVVINAAGVGLAAGVEQLREIAGLPSISNAVSASFVIVFEQAAPPVQVEDARVRQLIPGQDKTVAYFSATNTGEETVVLTSASTEAARAVELHTNVRDGDMMRMRRLSDVSIAPGETVEFAPGGHHLMVFGVKALDEPVTFRLSFADGGSMEVPFRVVGFG